MSVIVIIFLLVYVAMAFGRLPGFGVDRTGAATVGAMLLIAVQAISPAAAWQAIDYRAIGLLFGLMIVSSAFVVAGFYDAVATRVGRLRVSPEALLAIFVGVSGCLSAILTNDVVVVAMTPVLISVTLARRLNPLPFLLAFCFAANVGSAATLIGSPQNMIAAEALKLSFVGFLSVSAIPALLGLPIVWAVIAILYRNRWDLAAPPDAASAAAALPFNRLETMKAGVVTFGVVAALIFTGAPHMLVAMAGASVLLVNRTVSSSDMMRHVDGNLLLLLMGLFIVNAALASTGLPQDLLGKMKDAGVDLTNPISMLLVMTVLSNVVGNNPAVMLVAPFIQDAAHPDSIGAAIALGTGFSSNLVIFGSLAGIIIAEQGRSSGVAVTFREFSRAGLPVALLTLLLAAVWIIWLNAG